MRALKRSEELAVFKLMKGVKDGQKQLDMIKILDSRLSEAQSYELLMSKKVTDDAAQILLLGKIANKDYAFNILAYVPLGLGNALFTYEECRPFLDAARDIKTLVELANAESPNKAAILDLLTSIRGDLKPSNVPNALKVMEYCGGFEGYRIGTDKHKDEPSNPGNFDQPQFYFNGEECVGLDARSPLLKFLIDAPLSGERNLKEMQGVLSALHAHPDFQYYAAYSYLKPRRLTSEEANGILEVLLNLRGKLSPDTQLLLAKCIAHIAKNSNDAELSNIIAELNKLDFYKLKFDTQAAELLTITTFAGNFHINVHAL